MAYIAIAKKQWQPIHGVAHCQTEAWFLGKNPHKVDGNITENDAGFSLARIFRAKTPRALLLLNEWLRRYLSYIYIWIDVCFSIIQADEQHLWSGCADRKFILKWPTGRCLCIFVRLLCLVKSFAAISLSGRCDNPPLVPQVFITCHVFTFPTNFNSPDFMCDYADELTTKEISPPRSQEKLQ